MRVRLVPVFRLAALFAAVTIAGLLMFASPAFANRSIVVNGIQLSQVEASALDAYACSYIPDGRYWLLPNGVWGYEGVPVMMGVVGDQCYSAPRPGLSERGLLYSPGELLR